MISIGEVLLPAHVNLVLAAQEKNEAINEVLSKLNGDFHVKDFPTFQKQVFQRDASAISENGCGICIAHARTEAVGSLVMAAGRTAVGIPCKETPDPVRLFFVAGIPAAFNAEYLRIVGAIARICRDRHQLERLLAAKDSEHFVSLLSAGEVKL